MPRLINFEYTVLATIRALIVFTIICIIVGFCYSFNHFATLWILSVFFWLLIVIIFRRTQVVQEIVTWCISLVLRPWIKFLVSAGISSLLCGVLADYIAAIVIGDCIRRWYGTSKEKVFHIGFSELYRTQNELFNVPGDSPKASVFKAIEKYHNKSNFGLKRITVGGHSLGASLAVIATYHSAMTLRSFNKTIPIHCITFSCPAVASPEVFKSFSKLNIKHYHYLNRGDPVPVVTTGIFTNGLGFPNNHVIRLDPTNPQGDRTTPHGTDVPQSISPFLQCLYIFLSYVDKKINDIFKLTIPSVLLPENLEPVQGVIKAGKLNQVYLTNPFFVIINA